MKDISPVLGIDVWLREDACMMCQRAMLDAEVEFLEMLCDVEEPVTCGLFGPVVIEEVFAFDLPWVGLSSVCVLLRGAPRPVYREA